MAQLTIIAGPNGSGKSTFYNHYLKQRWPEVQYLNPDVIAAALKGNLTPAERDIKAGRLTLQKRKELIAKKQSFFMETTFSGHQRGIQKMIKSARDNGFKVNLVFVCTNDYKDNIRRIEQRIERGGHAVKHEDIKRRYKRSLTNMKNMYPLFDRTYLLDNTNKLKPKALFYQRKLRRKSIALSNWIKQLKIPALKQNMKLRLKR